MSGTTIQWIAVGSFLILFAAAIAAEALWLTRKGLTTPGRAISFVLVTDLLSFGISATFLFVLALLGLMLVFGPSGTGAAPGTEPWLWGVAAVAIALPPVILFLSKRAFLHIFKILSGGRAWVYSIVAAILIFLTVPVPSSFMLFLALR